MCACVCAGLLVQGVARLRSRTVTPLYQGELADKEVMVHRHYVNESLSLFLFYFLQLAVMATYISQDLVKLVPLLTIIFVFGRLVSFLFGSSHFFLCKNDFCFVFKGLNLQRHKAVETSN